MVFLFGKHRLLCGDSSNENNIKKLVGNDSIDLVFTDPPYNLEKEKLIEIQNNIFDVCRTVTGG